MAAVGLHLLLDGFAIGHAGGAQLSLHAEAALQAGHQHVQLHVAGAGEDHLAGLGVVDHGEGGIFLVHAGQACGHLVVLTAGLGGDGLGVAGLCEGDTLQSHHLTGVAQGVAGLDLVHLADGADVAAGELLDFLCLLAGHLVQTAQLFSRAGAGVDQGQVRGDDAGEDLDHGVLAVLIGDGLEHIGGGHAAGGDHEVLGLAVLTGGLVVVALHGVGQQVGNIVHQHQGADAVDSGAEEDGEHGQLPHALAQALDHLGIGEVLAAEVLVHHFLGGLSHGLLQSLVELGNHGGLVLGDVHFHPLVVLQLIGALVEHVDEAGGHLALVPHGNHQGSDLVAIALAQGVEGGVVVAVLLVDLGDIDEARHVALLAILPDFFKANGNAVLGGADDDGGVGGPQSLHDLAGEIECAGGVQQVDLAALVFQRGHSHGNGDLAADLLGIVVADRVAVRTSAHAADCVGHKQQTLGQGGLAAAAMPHQADITDVLYRITHNNVLSLLQIGRTEEIDVCAGISSVLPTGRDEFSRTITGSLSP